MDTNIIVLGHFLNLVYTTIVWISHLLSTFGAENIHKIVLLLSPNALVDKTWPSQTKFLTS